MLQKGEARREERVGGISSIKKFGSASKEGFPNLKKKGLAAGGEERRRRQVLNVSVDKRERMKERKTGRKTRRNEEARAEESGRETITDKHNTRQGCEEERKRGAAAFQKKNGDSKKGKRPN